MFLDADKKQANEEKNCFNMCLIRARRAFNRDEYDNTLIELNNAVRSVNELKALNNKKKMNDKARQWFINRQIESEKEQQEFLHSLKVNIYE